MDPIEAAINDINSLELRKSFLYKEIAEKYSVVRTTLARQHKGLTQWLAEAALNRCKLSLQ